MNITVVLKSETATQAPVLKAQLPTCGALCGDVLKGAIEDSALCTGRLQVTEESFGRGHAISQRPLYITGIQHRVCFLPDLFVPHT